METIGTIGYILGYILGLYWDNGIEKKMETIGTIGYILGYITVYIRVILG